MTHVKQLMTYAAHRVWGAENIFDDMVCAFTPAGFRMTLQAILPYGSGPIRKPSRRGPYLRQILESSYEESLL